MCRPGLQGLLTPRAWHLAHPESANLSVLGVQAVPSAFELRGKLNVVIKGKEHHEFTVHRTGRSDLAEDRKSDRRGARRHRHGN